MERTRKSIIYIGDQTDPWIDGIDYITKHAAHTPWLKAFMRDLCQTIKSELKDMEPDVTETLGNFQSLQELAEKYRGVIDQTGVANAILIHAVRATMLLQCIRREPHLLNSEHRPEWLGISGGILSLSALAVAKDFQSLYDACLWVGGLICRICRFCYLKSRAIEDAPGTWGCAVLGIPTDQLRDELDQFQKIMGIPERAHVAISGYRWNTIIGPPSVLEKFLRECPAVIKLPKNELNIHSLQHSLPTSSSDLDELVGNLEICRVPVVKGCKIWGTDEPPTQTGVTFGQFLRPVLAQALSRPLDVVKVVDELKTHLGSTTVLEIKAMGPSSHLNYLETAFKAPERRVTICPEISAKSQAIEHSYSGRIAIVGMSGRGPGCESLDELWKIISEGRDLHQEVPKDRFDLDEYFANGGDKSETPRCATNSRYGCFMDKPGNFDARFFRISPREALFMDPGHRQFLMSACEALETAGYTDSRSSDVDPRRIGVFYGQSSDDWHNVAHNLKGCDAYTLQSSQRAFGAGRLAFHMNWEGPTYSIDSACASSISCLHLACQSLLSHDIDMAVSGAANIIGYPHTWSALSKAGILSKTGNCKTFRDDADGYCRADFVGSVVLKRLEDAVAHNDNVLAVIAGSGRNHSGNSPSITTSDAAAQEQLFRDVLGKAGALPGEISYVEMHGTGTQIGDPAEMTAVTNVFSGPLAVGSIKANIGHSEAAAGIASLLKSILMFEKNVIPPVAGMPHRINPKLDVLLRGSKIMIPEKTQVFGVPSKIEQPKRILINNFDAAGGNSCLLLEEPNVSPHAVESEVEIPDEWSSHVVVATAKTPNALKINKQELLKWLYDNSDANIHDVAYTTTARRNHHQLRSAYIAWTTKDLIAQLESDVQSDQDASKPKAARTRPVIFMFTGQGSDYAGMGHQLYQTSRTFREKVDHCLQISSDLGFPSFSEIITDKQVDVSAKEPVQVQLAVLTLEIALAAIWMTDAGVEPSLVTGHSLGEYAALHVAGVLSLADVLYLVGHRALLLSRLCESGSHRMLAVSAPAEATQAWLGPRNDTSCSVACTNSPRSTILAGTADEIEQLKAEISESLGAPTKLLPMPYAFHSPQMDPLMKQYKSLARGATFLAPKLPVASTLLARVCDTSDIFDASYLWRQTREQCRFRDAVVAANERYSDALWLEIGPSKVLGSFVSATLTPPPRPESIISTLEIGQDNWVSLSKCLGKLTEAGVDIDWRRLYAPYVKSLNLLRLPTYAWDLQDFWITHTETNKDKSEVSGSSALVPFQPISTCAQSVLDEKSTSNEMQVSLQASLNDPNLNFLIRGHRVRGVGICPGSVFVDAAVATVKYLFKSQGNIGTNSQRCLAIRNLVLDRPLHLDSASSSSNDWLITSATSNNQDVGNFKVSFRSSRHALGNCTVSVCDGEQLQGGWNKMAHFIRARMEDVIRNSDVNGHKMQSSVFYALFSNTVQYDAAFKCARKVYISEDFQEAAAEIVLQQDPAGTTFASSPYIGESLVHLAGFVLNANPGRPRAAETTFIMSRVESLEQPDPSSLVPGKTYISFAHVSRREASEADCDVYVFDANTKKLVMQCTSLCFHETENTILDHLLGKTAPKENSTAATYSLSATQPQALGTQKPRSGPNSPRIKKVSSGFIPEDEKHSGIFEAILNSISTQTGTRLSELRDDLLVSDLGVDSIMAIEITSDVRRDGGTEFPTTFLTDYPTIGDLRSAFSSSEESSPLSFSGDLPVLREPEQTAEIDSGSSSDCPEPKLTPNSTPGTATPAPQELTLVEECNNSQESPPAPLNASTVKDQDEQRSIPPASARIMLLHGSPTSGHTPLYLIADGTGSIATYLHLNPLQSNAPVYGIDSPFSRAPENVSSAGITGIASIIVAALLKARPQGLLHIGGFSGGGMLAYEVSRQLADAGRQVDGLLMIDIACPRSEIDHSLIKVTPQAGFDMFQKMAAQDPFWSVTPSSLPMRHLLAFFEAVQEYHPPPMSTAQRPRRYAVIWAEKGLVGRCAENTQLKQDLVDMGFAVEPYAGFMQDSTLGAIAWGVPHKRDSEGALGPNGWDVYVGGDILCNSVDADHLEMLMPGHVHLLQAAVGETLAYFRKSTQ